MAYCLEQVRSLAPRTDLFIHRYRGLLHEREGYLVAETPGNRGFYWGNFLFFPQAPGNGDLARWQELFRREFAHVPEVKHITFAWDEESPGHAEEFLAKGYRAESGSVLSLRLEGLKSLAKEPAEGDAFTVRPLHTEAEWEAAIQNQIACRTEGWNLASYTRFKREQMGQYRRMVEEGHGHWWGAFLRHELVAECGLFYSGQLGRFQAVGTAPAQRRKGFCSRMVREICAQAFTQDQARTLVIVAEEGEPADFIYRSVGFAPAGKQFTLAWWPQEEARS